MFLKTVKEILRPTEKGRERKGFSNSDLADLRNNYNDFKIIKKILFSDGWTTNQWVPPFQELG